MSAGDAAAVLSIHALDTAGEEGIVVDAAACAELGCAASHVATSLLAMGDGGPEAVEALPAEWIGRALDAVLRRPRPGAVRVGILLARDQVETVGRHLAAARAVNVVVAPVLRLGASRLAGDETLEAIRRLLFPLSRVVVARAADLPSFGIEAGDDIESLVRAAAALREQGAPAALVTGILRRSRVVDVLDDGERASVLDATRHSGPKKPGIVAAHPAALAAHLARGEPLARAADAAQRFVGSRLARSG
jgi:hydroxymethylpyrimidine/phosphomethylpyrimidine kinase